MDIGGQSEVTEQPPLSPAFLKAQITMLQQILFIIV